MRVSSSLAFTVLTALTVSVASADPTNDVALMRKTFATISSVHADVVSSNGMTAAFDFVDTDKMHERLPNGVEIVWIGSNVWESISGAWRKIENHSTGFQTAVQYVRSLGLNDKADSAYIIIDGGKATVGGIETRKYHMIEQGTGSATDIWVGMNHLPVRVQGQVRSQDATLTITYSRYNSVAKITPPE